MKNSLLFLCLFLAGCAVQSPTQAAKQGHQTVSGQSNTTVGGGNSVSLDGGSIVSIAALTMGAYVVLKLTSKGVKSVKDRKRVRIQE